jgi:hypothetical protein|tara:strand:+ start:14 stop:187 length:174 start_codon:yes stop_codon:yes gene_type:complete
MFQWFYKNICCCFIKEKNNYKKETKRNKNNKKDKIIKSLQYDEYKLKYKDLVYEYKN